MMTHRILLLAFAGNIMWGAESLAAVPACTQLDRDFLVAHAKAIAGGMFAEIGVQIEWHPVRDCPVEAVRIEFSNQANRRFSPEALAYALPYEGGHIRVFFDRVGQHPASRQPILLAHVLVHEITHILQGVSRHAETGIMMAQWGTMEYHEMDFRPLRFTDADVGLIRIGLKSRETRFVAAKHTGPGELACHGWRWCGRSLAPI